MQGKIIKNKQNKADSNENQFKYIKNGKRNKNNKGNKQKPTWIPCSRQYSSQHALPTWIPAWPMWIEMHSLIFLRLKQKSTKNRLIHDLNREEENQDRKWRRRRLWRRLLLKKCKFWMENEEDGESVFIVRKIGGRFLFERRLTRVS